MTPETTYLELSEDSSSAHKFYEVTVENTTVTIRYGRIGTPGQTQVKEHPTPEKAQATAAKKIREKQRKGYEPAVKGVRKKRPVTRRQVASDRSTAKPAPLLWRFASGASAFGIFIDSSTCWVGNQAGQVFALDPQGKVLNQFKLPDGVKCLVADDVWIYAGCDDGKVYDLSGKIPRVAYEIDENVDIYWLDIDAGLLAVSDANGQAALFDSEEEVCWTRLSQGKAGWMVRCDAGGVYHGHSQGVTCYSLDAGKVLWQQATSSVLFGWQETSTVYAGTSTRQVHCFTKYGQAVNTCQCDRAVYSCATAAEGKYIFAGDNASSIYCFDESGKRLWKFASGCGSVLSMQYWRDRLYLVTTDGSLACLDVSDSAIAAAQTGTLPTAKTFKAPPTEASPVSTTLETTTDASTGVILECFKDKGKLRVRAVSPDYNSEWNVQFPKNLRQEGVRYWVQEVRESARGGFYRAYGEIKRLV